MNQILIFDLQRCQLHRYSSKEGQRSVSYWSVAQPMAPAGMDGCVLGMYLYSSIRSECSLLTLNCLQLNEPDFNDISPQEAVDWYLQHINPMTIR